MKHDLARSKMFKIDLPNQDNHFFPKLNTQESISLA